ncbi:helix-turn-helix transcriptional regulator [Sphingobium sp. CR28]|uniref:helix-turn-helix transcriptional regulator n=1 Tax=Sphingobium sp. CR28 TaxID=3400272 RepID=UPI003FF0B5E7
MEDIDDRFLRIGEVTRKTGRSRAAIYRMIADGNFPKQEKIGVRAVGWRLSAIMSWMEAPKQFFAPPT